MKYIVAVIRNQSLEKCIGVESQGEAENLVRDLFFQQFGRAINEEETDDLLDSHEICNTEDADNHWTFSIGILE